MKYDVVIIGSGLGGLQCGYILAKRGMRVCVLERAALLGGCLQVFKRGEARFDTGFHYVGGMDEGQPLHRLFSYFGLTELPWTRMDDQFDLVTVNGRTYPFTQGYEGFYDHLTKAFPSQREGLKAYLRFLKNTGDHIFDSFKPREASDFYGTSLFARPAKAFLDETVSDPLLRDVLAGTSLKMELTAQLPLYTFAQINNSFIQSAWRLKGGGGQIAESLAERIRAMGGDVRTRAEVTQLEEGNGKIAAALTADERFEANWFISDAHPATTLSWLKDCTLIRNIYRRRISALPNPFGMFTVNLRLKPGALPACRYNRYIYQDADLWRYQAGRTDRVLVNYYPEEGEYATRLDLLTPMLWGEVRPWAEMPMGRRGQSYVEMKLDKTEACVRLAGRQIPGLEDAIERDFTSTPLSYEHYTKTAEGSAYGIRKDFANPMGTVLTPKTPVPNLLLTGQNLNLHGILGVSMTSFFTTAEILGMETVTDELFKLY